jgi:hypothetical protein
MLDWFGRHIRAHLVSLAALALLATAPMCRADSVSSDQWSFVLTPYVWIPTVHGTLDFNAPPPSSGAPSVALEPSRYLSNLDLALMLAFEARKGDWSILTDAMYLDFSNEKAAVRSVSGPLGIVQVPVNTNTTAGLKAVAWTLAGGYTVARGDSGTLDVIAGIRYMTVEASVDWQFAGSLGLLPQAGSYSQRDDLWDAIAGVRGRLKWGGSNWFTPYYLDVGTGSSALTWQAMTGIGYAFGWGDLALTYRYLSYDMTDQKLLQNISFGGVAFGASFHF